MASSSRGPQQDSFIDDDDNSCPLCIEEFDLSDRNFKPCPCGYQVCQFCFNNIKEHMNSLCPACRRPYDEKTMVWKVVTPEEIAKFKADVQKNAKKKADQRQKEAQKREVENQNRKHLSGLRVIQKNLVYVVGLSQEVPEPDLLKTLRGDKYFGQYGQIIKIVVSKAKGADAVGNSSLGVYVTFARKEDAEKCILAVNGSMNGDRTLRAQLGTTKYCSAYLRNETCMNKQCMFLHEPGDNDNSYSRQDLSSINSVGTQRPLPPATASSSRTPVQGQPPIQQVRHVAAGSQPMAREPSKDSTDSGDGSALPSTANWGNRGIQQRSRRGSIATSGAASSPAISTSMPAPVEADESAAEQDNAIDCEIAVQPTSYLPPAPIMVETELSRLIKSINAFSAHGDITLGLSEEDLACLTSFPPLFDMDGGLKRKAIREQEEARLNVEQESVNDVASISEPLEEEEEPESGSGQLGGEPEDREDIRESGTQPQGFDTRRPSMQMPIQRSSNDNGLFTSNLGQNFSQNLGNLSQINGRTLTPQQMLLLKSGQQQQPNFLDQFQSSTGGVGLMSQSGLFQHQGHGRQSSRYSFANEVSTAAKQAGNPKILGQQSATIGGQQGNQYYGSAMPGPPPGLKSTGTPPIGGGLFGPSQGFGGSLGASLFGASRENHSDMLRELIRGRGGVGSGGQGHEAGKREFMFPSFLHQYPPTSTPAPASGLLASLYGPQPGAFHDFSQKQKKKGKKHRHANTSSSGGGGLVDLADPNIMQQARMPSQQQQSNAGAGQGLFGGQGQGGYNQNMMYGENRRW